MFRTVQQSLDKQRIGRGEVVADRRGWSMTWQVMDKRTAIPTIGPCPHTAPPRWATSCATGGSAAR